MEQLSSHDQEEGDINPLPINSYGGGGGDGSGHDHDHMMHHHHHSDLAPQIPSNNAPLMLLQQGHHVLLPHNSSNNKKKDDGTVEIRYMECLKNHAASMGGSATDGCGEFIPSGEQGTLEALHCSACNCHRNFHRKQIQGQPQPQPPTSSSAFFTHSPHFTSSSSELRKLILGHHHHQPKNVFKETDPTTPFSLRYPTKASASASASAHHKITLSYNNYISGSDHEHHQQELDVDGVMMMMPHHQQHDHNHNHNHLVKKRFRTKFTQEQKQKMLSFAEQIGWRLNKQEDDVVQQFCQEIGVKRRVLKVWMHNNKHNLAKKNNPSSSAT